MYKFEELINAQIVILIHDNKEYLTFRDWVLEHCSKLGLNLYEGNDSEWYKDIKAVYKYDKSGPHVCAMKIKSVFEDTEIIFGFCDYNYFKNNRYIITNINELIVRNVNIEPTDLFELLEC